MIVDAMGNPLEVILVDKETGSPSALPVALDIQLVPISEFPRERSSWLSNIVKPVQGDGPVLTGDISVTMKNGGSVTVNQLQFRKYSITVSMTSMFRIGTVPNGYNGPGKILEGITKAFEVQDNQNKRRSTRYPPLALDDEVWMLEGISWGGCHHRRLAQSGIRNIQDFLMMLAVKRDELCAVGVSFNSRRLN